MPTAARTAVGLPARSRARLGGKCEASTTGIPGATSVPGLVLTERRVGLRGGGPCPGIRKGGGSPEDSAPRENSAGPSPLQAERSACGSPAPPEHPCLWAEQWSLQGPYSPKPPSTPTGPSGARLRGCPPWGDCGELHSIWKT